MNRAISTGTREHCLAQSERESHVADCLHHDLWRRAEELSDAVVREVLERIARHDLAAAEWRAKAES